MNQNELNKFLKKLYDLLKKDEIITKEASTSSEKIAIITSYLAKLERVQNLAATHNRLNLIKNLYYDRYLIKEENIPESYWHYLENGYFENGNGKYNLTNPVTDEEKEIRADHVARIYREQKESLDVWLNYFLSKDSSYLDMWAKVWAFQGMLKMGTFNKKTNSYNKRTLNTVAPFVNLNAELVGKCVKYLKQHLNKETIADEDIQRLVNTESFPKLYESLLREKTNTPVSPNLDGKWVKYPGFNEESAIKLYNSLQGYNTGWCTAGALSTAKVQICGGDGYAGGDFYVYYLKDKQGEYKIPKIAIRMERHHIGEIRGTAEGQNLESGFEDVLASKLQEFPDKDLYLQKLHDMAYLKSIYTKFQNKEDLTREELSFIYEIDNPINRFGYDEDPRVEEIKKNRHFKKDLSFLLNCKPSEIGTNRFDLLRKLVYYQGDIEKSEVTKSQNLFMKMPDIIDGDMLLSSLTIEPNLKLPKKITYGLNLQSLTTVDTLVLPRYVGSDLNLESLTTYNELILPQNIKGCLFLSSLENAQNLVFPAIIDGDVDLSKVKTMNKVVLPKRIEYSLYLNSLTSLDKVALPEIVGGRLYLNQLEIKDLRNVKLPQVIGTDIVLKSGKITLPELKAELAQYQELTPLLEESTSSSLRRGKINLLIILVPLLIIFLGIFLAIFLL